MLTAVNAPTVIAAKRSGIGATAARRSSERQLEAWKDRGREHGVLLQRQFPDFLVFPVNQREP
jgi:hypothetical protein